MTQSFLEGKGFMSCHFPFEKDAPWVHIGLWPGGYPFLIAIVSWITNLPLLASSKIVNILLLGGCYIFIYKIFKTKAWFPSLFFFSYCVLQNFSYTWSEGPFIFCSFILAYLLSQNLIAAFEYQKQPKSSLFLKIGLVLSALFCIRYSAIIYYLFTCGIMLFFFFYKEKRAYAYHYFFGLTIASLVSFAYFYYNLQTTGYYTGMDRVGVPTEEWGEFIAMVIVASFNELMVIRNYYLFDKGWYVDHLFVLCFLAQSALTYWLIKHKSLLKSPMLHKASKGSVMIAMGLFYMILTIVLRKIQPFDMLNYRYFGPSSVLIGVGLLGLITEERQALFFQKIKKPTIVFFIFSLFMNAPKAYIIHQILNLLRNSFWT